MYPIFCTNTYHDVTDLVNYGMGKNTKTWISRERNINFLWNKKPMLHMDTLRNYRLVVVVTINICFPLKGHTSCRFVYVYIYRWYIRFSETPEYFTRSTRPEVFSKKCVFRNFAKFTGKHLRQSLFFNKGVCLKPEIKLKLLN